MKKKLPKIEVESVCQLSAKEMNSIKGGFLSIGFNCSERNKCARLYTKTWSIDGRECYNNPLIP